MLFLFLSLSLFFRRSIGFKRYISSFLIIPYNGDEVAVCDFALQEGQNSNTNRDYNILYRSSGIRGQKYSKSLKSSEKRTELRGSFTRWSFFGVFYKFMHLLMKTYSEGEMLKPTNRIEWSGRAAHRYEIPQLIISIRGLSALADIELVLLCFI